MDINKITKVYHGTCSLWKTNQFKIENIDLTISKMTCDFGSGFYTAPFKAEAKRRAKSQSVKLYEYHDYLHDGNSLHDELYDKKLISETEYVAYCRGKIMPKPEQKEYKPKIIEYQLDKKVMEKLNIMVFDDCSLKWAEYAMQYRSGREKTLNMDIDVIFAPTMDGISPILSKLQREFKKTGKLTDEMYNNVLPRNYAEYGVGESWQMYFRTLKSLELLGNSIIELR